MDLLEIDKDLAEIIPRGDMVPHMGPEHLQQQLTLQRDNSEVALEIVSETAAAIRLLEEQSAQAVARAQELARSVVEKLEMADTRVEHLEAQTAQLSEELSWTREQLEMTQNLLGSKEADLARAKDEIHITQERVVAAEQRAIEANASIERIVQAIRTQLPVAGHFTGPQ